jgi:hypothetical protein
MHFKLAVSFVSVLIHKNGQGFKNYINISFAYNVGSL